VEGAAAKETQGERRQEGALTTKDTTGMAIRTGKKGKAKAEAVEDDGKTDVCVMCHQGGKMICCEVCPASFHMRYAARPPTWCRWHPLHAPVSWGSLPPPVRWSEWPRYDASHPLNPFC
jgi:hypothetical protein